MSRVPTVLVIDNYDSFTYNLVQYLGELGAEVKVVRNDEVDVGALIGCSLSHAPCPRSALKHSPRAGS